jgi:putative membrane protein
MSADRTLMSVVRTALSLIGFGFTIFQFFRYLRESVEAAQGLPVHAASNFGLALVVLGVGLLTMGIWYHVQFMLQLRSERRELLEQGLLPGDDRFPVSLILIIASLLWLLGLVAIINMLRHVLLPS